MSAVEKEQPEAAKTRFAKDQLKAFVERIERLEEEKKTISDDIRDVYAESKGNGFDVKALRAVIRLRKQEPRSAQEQQLDPGNLYERAGHAGGGVGLRQAAATTDASDLLWHAGSFALRAMPCACRDTSPPRRIWRRAHRG